MSRAGIKRTVSGLIAVVIAVVGVWASIYCFAQIYATEELKVLPAILGALGGGAAAVAVNSLKRPWIGKIIIILGLATVLWLWFFELAGGMIYIVNNVIDSINEYYDAGLYYMAITKKMARAADQHKFVLIICVLAGYGYSAAMIRGRRGTVAAATALAMYMLPATLGDVPQFACFAGTMVFVSCCLIRLYRVRKARLANMQAVLYTASVSIIVILVLSVLWPGRQYVPYAGMDSLKGKLFFSIQDAMSFNPGNFKSPFDIKPENGISAGSIGRVGSIEHADEPMFLVTAPKASGTIYLKAFQAEVYSRRQWRRFDESVYAEYENLFSEMYETGFDPATETSHALQYLAGLGESGIKTVDYEIEVTQYRGDDYSYIPVGTMTADGKAVAELAEYDREASFPYSEAGEKDVHHSYEVTACDMNTSFYYLAAAGSAIHDRDEGIYPEVWESDRAYFEMQEEYRRFVYANYLDANTGCAWKINKEIIPAVMTGEYSLNTPDGKVQFIKDTIAYFDRNYMYSLEPGTTPDDRDFVEHFLFYSKKGFCTAFASSAVMMFRLAGIPARYVEGYVVPDSIYWGAPTESRNVRICEAGVYDTESWDYYEVVVTDRYAHAWVEVYVDGIGWVSVDPTPGFSSYPGAGTEDVNDSEGVTDDTSQTEPDTMDESDDVSDSTAAGTTDEQGSSEVASDDTTKESAGGETGTDNSAESSGGMSATADEDGTGTDTEIDLNIVGERIMSALKSAGRAALTVMRIAAIPGFFVLILVFRQKYVEQKRGKLYNRKCGLDRRTRVCRILKYFDKLVRYSGQHIYGNESYTEQLSRRTVEGMDAAGIAVLIEKALYSKETVDEDETMQIFAFVSAVRGTMYQSMKWYEKLYFKYILAY